MTSEGAVEHAAISRQNLHRYAPSWVDRVDGWIGALPVPRWLVYLLLAVTLVVINAMFKWWDGVYPVGSFLPFHVLVTAYTVWYFALVSYLNWTASRAMERFRPAYRGDDATYTSLCYRLTTMPARPTLLVSLAGAVWGIFLLIGVTHGRFLSTSAMVLRSPHSIWFEYAIAITGNIASLSVFIVLIALGVITFVAPLIGVHRMLENEKNAALNKASARLHVVLDDLHQRIDQRDFGGLDALNKAMAGLKDELALLEKTPTWPWKPETLRLLSTAILLPILLWLMTRLLERVLNL
ncbi:MAG: hypothetical protein BroJett021_02050 [Chloroflexota bacterium]|jgi:hypothetical protein|nr:hypothetical protein [Caldilinea sp.]GIK71217.1 MAG: hypothetical protein BroJett021_02050 [Chloroflexota bacterium]